MPLGLNVSGPVRCRTFTLEAEGISRVGVMGTRTYLGIRCGDIMWVEDWTPRAACKSAQPDQLFVRGAEQNKAKQLCSACPVRTECLAEALDNQIEWGVWGGMTERERRALLRRRPNASWRTVLETAREQSATSPAARTTSV